MAIIEWWRRGNWRRDEQALAGLGEGRPAMLVTGASQGIGLELARAFAARGRTVVLVARGEEGLQRAVADIKGSGDVGADVELIALAVDITAADAADRLGKALAERGLYVEELVNNAGFGLSGRFAEEDPTAIDELMILNMAALTRLMRAFLPAMLIRGRGGVINVASLGGFAPGAYQAAYYASKAYVISLTRALAEENSGMGVRFTSVAPGPVDTKFHAQMDAERAFYRRFLPALTPDRVARTTVFWYGLGSTIIVPGVFNTVLALCLRILPGFLTIPTVAFLLNPRDDARDL